MATAVQTDRKSVVAEAVSKIGDIATLPEITLKIIEVVENPKSTARDLHAIIKNDPALSAKILKVVNSAFYGLPGQIADMNRAIVLLGLSAVKNIAIAASISRMFKGDKPHPHFTSRDLWRHSVTVAVASRRLALAAGNKSGAEELFLGGLIHDLGILVERQAFGDRFLRVVDKCHQSGIDLRTAEAEEFGADHQDFGMGLGARWKFPKHLVSLIGYHHVPELLGDTERRLVSFVRIADILACQENLGFSMGCAGDEITNEMLGVCGLNEDHIGEIRELLPEDAGNAEATFL